MTDHRTGAVVTICNSFTSRKRNLVKALLNLLGRIETFSYESAPASG